MNSNRFRFTKARLNALLAPPGVRQRFFYDEASHGLCVSVTQSGTKAFYVLRKFKGRTERVHIGRYPATTIAQARKRAGQINSQFDAGHNANEIKRCERGELTLEDLYAEYMKRHAYVHNRRPDLPENNYRLYLSHWAKRRLSMITRFDVQHWHARTGSGRGERTANNALSLLRAMYNRAIDWDLFTGINPATGVRQFKNRSRDRFLLPDELKRFLDALRGESNHTIRDCILMLLLTGARKTNTLTMRWKDLNLDSGVWTIPDTKNGEKLVLPLSPQALTVLEQRAARMSVNSEKIVPISKKMNACPGAHDTIFFESEYVFPGTGQSGHLQDPKKCWKALLQRANIQNFRMHDLRRTHGSYMAAAGANAFVIGRALGHKDIATTAIYARIDLGPVRMAADQAARIMLQDMEVSVFTPHEIQK